MVADPNVDDQGRRKTVTLTIPELQEVIRETAHQTVEETLERYGVDVKNPNSQRRDNVYLRRSREISEEAGTWIRRTFIGLTATGILYAVWEGLRQFLRSQGKGP